ncbi:MAG: ABC transporter substrate-binding protein [Hyphomicrobiaceae bacterium]
MRAFLSKLAFAMLLVFASPAFAEIVLTDVKGREVRLPKPAERVVLGFYYEDFIAIAGPDAMNKVVAVSLSPWKDWRPKQFEAYLKVYPGIADLPDIGDTETGNFSIEKAIASKPDLVILAAWSWDVLGESVKQFEAAGIPVVVLDYNAQTIEKHVQSTIALGKAMGTEDRAEQLVALYKSAMADIEQRIATAKEPKKKVYVELAKKGPSEVGNSYGNGMWGGLIDSLGGINIAKGQVENWGPLSPEYVLAEQPDVILLAGSEWLSSPNAVLVGFGADKALANERVGAYLTRAGWSDLPAVRNGEVHAIYHGGARTLSDFVYAQYIAKILYPDAFADLDPTAELAKYYAAWLPIPAEGVFVLKHE